MKKVKTAIDLVLIFALPILMGYSLVSEFYHEIIGISIGVLFVVRMVLNRKWFSSLFRGRYNIRRIVMLIVNLCLIISMLNLMVSGVFISKHVFRFLGIHTLSSQMRKIHMLASYWGLLILSFHAGIHGSVMISKLKPKPAKYAVGSVFLLISAYGVHAFDKRGFYDFLFGKVVFVFFDRSEPFVYYYLDYLAVMILFMTLGYLFIKLTKLIGGKNGIRNTK